MDPTLIAIIASSSLTVIGLLVGYTQWRRDVKIKLGQIRETVSVELIRQRIEPYATFYKQLEALSSIHAAEIEANPKKAQQFIDILQENIYGTVGLIASHETRLILLYVRSGCKEVTKGKIPFSELRLRLWALHFSLRSDLGISQPLWSSEIEKVRTDAISLEERSIAELVKTYPWDRVYNNQVGEERPLKKNA